MCKIPANAGAFFMAFRRRAVAPRMVVSKLNALIDVVADRLDPRPAADNTAEQ
jgi:hypothetical protein